MPIQKMGKNRHNGKLINWDDAQLHVISHVVNYGSSAFTLAFLAINLLLGTAWAQTVYSFSGPDGANPRYAGVVADAKGDIYGTTSKGGAHNHGVVFKITPSGQETVLHSFHHSDGAYPQAGVVLGAKGDLYGTTLEGGAHGYGVVFKLAQSGEVEVIYSFKNSPDGANPYAGLILDAKGNLYGTTAKGGAHNYGVVFKVTPSGKENVIYSFKNNPDGATPYAKLAFDAKGNLYGTTREGGTSGHGTVFKVTPSGKENVIYSFAGDPDGFDPLASGVVLDGAGNIYGTTVKGGAGTSDCGTVKPPGLGTLYMVTPSGSETVLYRFTDRGLASPQAGVLAVEGNLYGTAAKGGAGYGGLFRLEPKPPCGSLFTVLHVFNYSDGAYPEAGFFVDANGNVYGTTNGGGEHGLGTVYKGASDASLFSAGSVDF